MASPSDYDAMLQSMSAMSQQFSWNGQRSGYGPQRVLSQRSRIQKPSSRNTSPQNIQRRRTAPIGRRPIGITGNTAPYHLQPPSFVPMSQHIPSQTYLQNPADCHPYFDTQRQSMPQAFPMHNTQQFPGCFTSGFGSIPQAMPISQPRSYPRGWTLPRQSGTVRNQVAHQAPISDISQNPADLQQIYCPSTDPYAMMMSHNNSHIMASTASGNQESRFTNTLAPTSTHDSIQPLEEDGKVLVGISLYDIGLSASAPTHAHNSSLMQLPTTGHGLKLEETWAPTPEDVPDAVADDGSNTPTMTDTATLRRTDDPEPDQYSKDRKTSAYEGTLPQFPQPNDTSAEPFIFDEEMGFLASEWDINDGSKPLPINWDDHSWLLDYNGPYM